jgi:hypothetical protein
LGRFKKIEIEGLLFEDFGKIFVDTFNEFVKTTNLPEKEVLKKIGLKKFEELLISYEDGISTVYLENHKFNLEEFLKAHFRNQKKIAKTNENSFEAFILYVNGCYVVYEKILQKLKRKKIDSTLKMTVALYGLIIRRADMIVNQLLNGYIDGAMIIWRSLYENAIILLLLAYENNNELADKYFKHSVRNSRKKVLSYNANYKALKFKPLPASTDNNLKSEVKNAETKYGKDFLDNEYGWADSLFSGKQKANFRQLEERVEMTRFRPYYLLCCEHLHPSFNGLQNYMDGNKINLQKILMPSIDLESFVDPMQFTVSILQEINEYILYEFSIEEEYNVNVLLMRKVFEKQQNTFNKTKNRNAGRRKTPTSV